MEILSFKKEDIKEVNDWYLKRRLPALEEDSFPQVGFVIRGIAAIFIYLTDSNIALIEGLISNPEVSFLKRGRALMSLIHTAHAAAQNLRERVVVLVKEESVEALALSLGYASIGKYELLVRG